jgi:hypothetical protein
MQQLKPCSPLLQNMLSGIMNIYHRFFRSVPDVSNTPAGSVGYYPNEILLMQNDYAF